MSSSGIIQGLLRPLLFAILILWTTSACMTPSIVATQSVQMGDRANNEHNYDMAIQHYQTYLETSPSLGTMRNPLMEADICRKLAHCYSVHGNYIEAGSYLRKALLIDEKEADNKLNIIEDYRLLGVSQIYTGQYDSALHYLDIAMAMNEGMESSIKAVKKLSIADTYLSKSQLELSMGLFNESQEDVLKAIELYEQEKNEFGKMEGYLIMAKNSIAKGDPDQSREYVNKSITAARLEGYKLFRQYQVLADIEINLGYPEQAVIARQDALTEARESQIIPQVIWACLRLGDAYNELGNTDKAREYYREARDLEMSINQKSSLTPSIQMRLGELHNAYDLFNSSGATLGAHIATLNLIEDGLLANNTDSAIALLDQSISYFRNQGIAEGEGKAMIMQSIIYKNKSEYERSLAVLAEVERLALRPEISWKLKYNKALVYQRLNDDQAQGTALQEAITIIEAQRSNITSSEFKWHYLDQKTDVFDTYISLLLSKENPTKNDIIKSFEINERARSRTFLDMLLDQNLVSSDPQINREISLIKENQQLLRIIQEKSLKGVEVASIKRRLKNNEEELSQLESKLDQSTQKFTRLRTVEPVKLADLQRLLDGKTAVLEFWAGKDQLVVWKITQRDISHKVLKTGNAELHRSVAKLRNLVKFGLEDRILAGFKELNDSLESGFQDVFKEYDNVIVIPHGPLHFIPFDALTDGKNFIVEQAVLHYSPSAAVYYYATLDSMTPLKNNLLGMALGEYEIDEHPGLPGTAMELNQLAQFYPDNNLVFEDKITESYFKEHAEEYELIHLASHGVFNRNKPGRSYILMSPSEEDDGKLMVDEIYDTDLNANLVALSACETGLGDLSEGDELVGLSRAFLYAGTSAIIVSLWKVDDISTSILMTRMHQLIRSGMSPDQALAEAKRSLIAQDDLRTGRVRGAQPIIWHPQITQMVNSSKPKHTSPYYWAPFIIIGGRLNH